MIHRKFIERLQWLSQQFPVMGIVGPRQVGKTTLSKALINSIDKETIYLDLESPKDLNILSDAETFFERNQDKCIILDEIQREPHLFPILRAAVDKHRVPSRFVILGSASPDLIRDSSESLAGRIAYTEITPFQPLEIHNNYTQSHHWLRGGFPDAFLAESDSRAQEWMRNFILTYIERDLPLLGLPHNPDFIRRLLTMISHIHGQLLNVSTLSNSLGVDNKTISKHIDFLEQAYLIRRLPSYHFNSKKRLIKAPKIYIRDSGLLHYFQQIHTLESLNSHPIVGNSWEGYVTEHIINAAKENYDTYFYRTQDGTEMDLVLTKAGIPDMTVEVKKTGAPKITRGMTTAIQDLATKNNFIVVPGEGLTYPLKNDIEVSPLVPFLKRIGNRDNDKNNDQS